MTDWRAVGYGFVVMLIAGLLATFVPVVGHIGAGLLGGFVSGYLAGGGLLLWLLLDYLALIEFIVENGPW